MQRHDDRNNKPQEAIRRQLLRWHLGYFGWIAMLIVNIALVVIAAFQATAYFTYKDSNPMETQLYVALLLVVLSLSIWRLRAIFERRLRKTAEQRRGDHPFYGKFIDGLEVIEGK